MLHIHTVDLFCQVVDNFGDIGVSWRLARQLVAEHELDVTLWVDDLASFHRICRAVHSASAIQIVDRVTVRRWCGNASLAGKPIADLVIEAFGCRLPDTFLERMAEQRPKPVWINLEYLSAESWIEGCHMMASPHPSLPLTKYFFFPGFTGNSGGLLQERGLAAQRDAFLFDATLRTNFIEQLTRMPCNERATRVSLFCYADAPVESLFRQWEHGDEPVLCIVPEGVAVSAVQAFLAQTPVSGVHIRRGNLCLRVVPFVDQPAYDRLLWACDLNFVRGEDSFVRAQWAQKPFIWQIYPQDDNVHLTKLDAFLDRYLEEAPSEAAAVVRSAWHAWNSGGNVSWTALRSTSEVLTRHASEWSRTLSRRGDLASNIIGFAEKIG